MKALAGRGGAALYLDYDGVVHNENVWWSPRRGPFIKSAGEYRLFEHAPLLETLLAPYPDAVIVLSTSWVLRYGFSKAAKRLPSSLRNRVVGATYHSEMNMERFAMKPRGQQIWEDVCRRGPRIWLAIDDDADGWPSHCRENLVLSDPVLGISSPVVVAELNSKLVRMA